MTERLLQFIWQFQYFNRTELTSVSGEPLTILIPGQYNTNQGPDFSGARIKIDSTTWAGSVELHIKTSDWDKHKHETDINYKNIILHVVWENDGVKNRIPVLELKDRVSKILLERYEELMNSSFFIPCEKSITTVKDITWKSWKDRLLAERLLRKSAIVETYLHQNNNHWEETFWWLLARNFGFKVNADTFEAIARSLGTSLLAKHKNQVQQLEALLIGQAGLLDKKVGDDYAKLLQREYRFLKDKYGLKPIHHPIHFLRMRPGNFPTIRLAQLAMLVNSSVHLFAGVKDTNDLKDIREWFDVTANDYWHYHYRFDDESTFKKKKLGDPMIDNIIINTVAPVLFAYGTYHGENRYKEKAVKWLEQTAAESNNIITGFEKIGVENKNAFDSQGLIELKTQYCDRKMCLECAIGNFILKLKQ
ncbi:MAG TPA: DUF2851 family protein [Chitinophagaceae bacterium]|jgi:hypothetical protein|nr:DUF2851 family protein [Chitinophagaceae bacterium]